MAPNDILNAIAGSLTPDSAELSVWIAWFAHRATKMELGHLGNL